MSILRSALIISTVFVTVSDSAISQTKTQVQRIIDRADSIYYSQPDSSFVLASDAVTKARQNKYDDLQALAMVAKARYHLLKADYRQVELELKTAIEIFKKISDKDGLANAYNLKSILVDRLGRKNEALSYLNESIRLFNETGNIGRLVDMYNNLANKYIELEKPELAYTSLQKIKPYLDRVSALSLYFYYQNTGKYHAFILQLDSALIYLQKAHTTTIELKMRDSEITALTHLAEVNFLKKDFAAADKYLTEAEKKAIEYKLDFELEEVYKQMAISSLHQGKADQYATAIEKRFDTHARIKDIEKNRELVKLKHQVTQLEAGESAYKKLIEEREYKSNLYLILFLAACTVLVFMILRKGKKTMNQSKNEE